MPHRQNTVDSISVYGETPEIDPINNHILGITVDNEPGVLARVIGLFSGRGYNIETLTVAEVDLQAHLSRITIACSGTALVIRQIKTQLARMVPVHHVADLTVDGAFVARELALIKVICEGDNRIEALRIAEIFRARAVDSTLQSFVFEVTGGSDKVSAFIQLMRPLGLKSVSRTGIAAMARGDIDTHF
jgi:acetolactate synthase-1/3 small subunit